MICVWNLHCFFGLFSLQKNIEFLSVDSEFSCRYAVGFLSIHWLYFVMLWPLHTMSHLFSIRANQLWAHYLGFCLHFSISICLACPCVICIPFTSLHHDLNSWMLHLCFFRFNYYECVLYIWLVWWYLRFTWLTLGSSHNETVSSCIDTHLLVFVCLGFDLIVSLAHIPIWQNLPLFPWRVIILSLYFSLFVYLV